MEINETLSHEAQIDTQLAELSAQNDKQAEQLKSAHARLVTTLTRGKGFDERRRFAAEYTLQQLVDQAWKFIEDGAPAWILDEVDAAFEIIRKAQGAIQEINLQIDALNAQYTGWSRFFLVQNNNGHIHSSLHCSTCHITTQFGWLPSVSGKTEADAVAEFGEILCSVCYPSAPVAWTMGISKVAQAAKDAKAAEKAAKDADKAAKAITAADGSPLRTKSYGIIKTEVTARRELASCFENALWYPQSADKYMEEAYYLAEAIAKKTGEGHLQLMDAAGAKAAKKVAKERRA